MTASLYNSATGVQAPHCLHAIGIGRTGIAYVEALLRTGEVEDLLEDPRARFAAMVVDIGDQDLQIVRDYAGALAKRLEERGIPASRFQFQAIVLEMKETESYFSGMNRTREYLKLEYPRYYWNPNYESYVPHDTKFPKAGEHFPRSIAKGLYANAYYDGERPMNKALDKFVSHIEEATLPSMITVSFSLAGGTGSGIVVDLARHLATVKLGRRIPVIGVGQLPHSGDPEVYKESPGLYTTLNELDCMLDDDKNAGVTTVWGDLYRSPFTGGFFVVNPEQSWQRLSSYTDTGNQKVRYEFKQLVTNRFVADSFMRFAVLDKSRVLFRSLRPTGFTGAPHETISSKSRNWTMFNVAKLTHPGVQVLPGQSGDVWDETLAQWSKFIATFDGLVDGFETDFAELHIHCSRDMNLDKLTQNVRETVTDSYLMPSGSSLQTYHYEFFDALTSYCNVILPGVAKTDLTAFWNSQKNYDALNWKAKLAEHAWLIDLGPMISEPAIRFKGMAGECIWGCACWVVVPYDQLRGDVLPPANRKVIREEAIRKMTETVVATPQ